MRCFDQSERQDPAQPCQAPGGGRRRAREQEQDAAQKREEREHARGDLFGEPPEVGGGAGGLRSAQPQLVGDEQDERHRERQQVVNRPIDHERGDELARRVVGTEQQHDHSFEHAEPAGHVAAQAEQLRGEKRAEDGQERGAARWHQHEEHRSGERPVEHRHAKLAERERGRRERNDEPPDAERRRAARLRERLPRAAPLPDVGFAESGFTP